MKIKTTNLFKFFKILESIIFPLYLSGQASAELLDTCHLKDYPQLHSFTQDVSNSKSSKTIILHTVPFQKVQIVKEGIYFITHPDPQNECAELIAPIITGDAGIIHDIKFLKKYTKKHPRKRNCCSITIEQVTKAGKKADWKIYAIFFPAEKLKKNTKIPVVNF